MTEKRYSFGICSWYFPVDQEAACKLAAEIGLDGMEIDIGAVEDGLPLADPERQKSLLEAAENAGIALSTIGANTLCNHGMSDPAEAKTVQEILSTLVKTAAQMEIGLIQLPSFVNGFIRNDDDLEQTDESLRFACTRAAEYGITVGTENALSVKDAEGLLNLVDAANLKIYFDTSNPYWMAGLDTVSMIEPQAPHICEHHVKDQLHIDDGKKGKLVPLGEGESSFVDVAKEIVRSGYRGWIHLENFYPVGDDRTVENSIARLANDVEIMKATFVEELSDG